MDDVPLDPGDAGDVVRWRRRLRRGFGLALALSLLGMVGAIVFGGSLGAAAAAIAKLPAWAIAGSLACVAVEWIVDAARFAWGARVFAVRAPARFWLELALIHLSVAYATNLGPAASAWVLTRRGMTSGEALALAIAKQALFVPVILLPAIALMALAPTFAIGPGVTATLQVSAVVAAAAFVVVFALAASSARTMRFVERITRRRGRAPALGFLAGIRRFFYERPRLLVGSLALVVGNQAAIVVGVVVLLRGFDAEGGLGLSTWGAAFLFATISQMSPTPGGAGFSELGGVVLFRSFLAPAPLVAFLVLARVFTMQLPILAGGVLLARRLRRV